MITKLIDRAVATVSPGAGLKRMRDRAALHFLNSGYSHGGASKHKPSMKGWDSRGGSTREDIELNLQTLRERSRDLHMNTPGARAIINRKTVNAIGTGLMPRFIPNHEILGITADEAIAWGRQRHSEFMLWANSQESDRIGLLNFFENQFVAFASQMLSGDAFTILGMGEGVEQPYELQIHVIEADRVRNPGLSLLDPNFHDGVEVDPDSGRVVAYWLAPVHPLAKIARAVTRADYTRIPVRGERSGRLNIIHLLSTERPEQYRGVPLLAPVIEHLKQISRYSEAELQAAVISAFFTVFITQEQQQGFLGEEVREEKTESGGIEEHEYLGPGEIWRLNERENVQFANPQRPNSSFAAFEDAIWSEIGAAVDIPKEEILLHFNTSYTAARAALLEFWKSIDIMRARWAQRFCDPIAALHCDEAVLKGRLVAPGYMDDPAIRAAWLRAQWHGAGPGQINEVVEVKAALMRIDGGLSTYAREAQAISGMSIDDIIITQADERRRLQAAGIVVPKQTDPSQPTQLADGTPV